MRRRRTMVVLLLFVPIVAAQPGCRGAKSGSVRQAGMPEIPLEDRNPVRQIVCLYDQRPWLNLDTHGDQDPEGVRFRAFLNTGDPIAEHRDGSFYVQMYRIARTPEGVRRQLVSDWHVRTEDIQPIKSAMLGYGYHLMLRWALKEIAGSEVEIVTTFEDVYGRKTRAGTKRLRVPKYDT